MNPRFLRIPIENLFEKRFLVPKRGIQTGAIDTHRLGQIGNGCSLIPFAPKDFQRSVEGFIEIKLSWTSHGKPFAFASFERKNDGRERRLQLNCTHQYITSQTGGQKCPRNSKAKLP